MIRSHIVAKMKLRRASTCRLDGGLKRDDEEVVGICKGSPSTSLVV